MPEWWEDFFLDDAWQGAQIGLFTDEDNAAHADRVERALALEPGSRVLDVPCGTGRIAIELAARGYTVTGIDITERFLNEGRRIAEERGVAVEFMSGDMRALDLAGSDFDGAISGWGSWGYFDEEGDSAYGRGVAGALRPGGRFLIDCPSIESIFPNFKEKNWFRVGETTVLMETEFNLGTARVETQWTFIGTDGSERTRRSSIRIYTVHELTELLRAEGFDSFQALDDELEEFAIGSHRLWLVATKGES